MWTMLNWTSPATPDHPGSTSTRSGSFQLRRTPSCSQSLWGRYQNGTLLPPLRVSCHSVSSPFPFLCWPLVAIGNYYTDPDRSRPSQVYHYNEGSYYDSHDVTKDDFANYALNNMGDYWWLLNLHFCHFHPITVFDEWPLLKDISWF